MSRYFKIKFSWDTTVNTQILVNIRVLSNLEKLVTSNPKFWASQLHIVVWTHGLTVGSCVTNNKVHSFSRCCKFSVFAQEICTFANWTNDIMYFFPPKARFNMFNMLISLVKTWSNQFCHWTINDNKILISIALYSDNFCNEVSCVSNHWSAWFNN